MKKSGIKTIQKSVEQIIDTIILKKKSLSNTSWISRSLSIDNRYFYVTFFLFAFFLPIHTRVSNFFVIVSLVISIYLLFATGHSNKIVPRWKILFFTTLPLFILHVIGIFYSDHQEEGYHFIERTISYILAPIIFLFFSTEHLQKIKRALLLGLLVGSSISIVILTVINLYHYFDSQDTLHIGLDLFDYYHTYLKFTKPLEQHPTYLGIYYVTAMIFLGDMITQKRIRYALIVLFGIGFLFLNSRIIFLVLLILVGYRAIRSTRRLIEQKKFVRLAFIGLGTGSVLFFLMNFLSDSYIGFRLKNIYLFEISTKTEENFNSHAKANPRMARYISALKLVRERPFFGFGVADERINLKRQFTKDGLILTAEQDYDSHNQYIGYAIRFGLFGVIVLLFFIIANAYLAFRAKDFNFLLFVIVIACVNIAENYFDRNYGITFTAIFFTIFTYGLLQKTTAPLNKDNV